MITAINLKFPQLLLNDGLKLFLTNFPTNQPAKKSFCRIDTIKPRNNGLGKTKDIYLILPKSINTNTEISIKNIRAKFAILGLFTIVGTVIAGFHCNTIIFLLRFT